MPEAATTATAINPIIRPLIRVLHGSRNGMCCRRTGDGYVSRAKLVQLRDVEMECVVAERPRSAAAGTGETKTTCPWASRTAALAADAEPTNVPDAAVRQVHQRRAERLTKRKRRPRSASA